MLHGEAQNLLATIQATRTTTPSVADALDPVTFVNKINVPVFMACQWEDEQTGGHCADLAQHFTGTSKKWFTFTNGAHIDSLDPETFNRWYDFLELYVAQQAPNKNATSCKLPRPSSTSQAMGVPQTDGVTLPADPIQQIPTYSTRWRLSEACRTVRVLFDNGAGTSPTRHADRGRPLLRPSSSRSRAARSRVRRAQRWYFGPNGTLTDTPPSTPGVNAYTSNANATPADRLRRSNTGTGGLWGNASQWDWHWTQNPSGTAVSYVTAPLTANTPVIGAGAVYALGAIIDARRRPAGHGQRGATPTATRLRPKRLHPGQ